MISHGKDMKIFTGNANPALAQEICKLIGIKLGEAEVKSFADGEASVMYRQLREPLPSLAEHVDVQGSGQEHYPLQSHSQDRV